MIPKEAILKAVQIAFRLKYTPKEAFEFTNSEVAESTYCGENFTGMERPKSIEVAEVIAKVYKLDSNEV